jgi:uncharacterized protein YndB with AHSA1/START domain
VAVEHREGVVERAIRIEARPETVFEFFVDPEKMMRWKGERAELDPRPGGIYRVEMSDVVIARGEYLAIDPPSRVEFTWGWEGQQAVPPGSSRVEVTFEPDGDGTVVRLRHFDLPAEERAIHEQGWVLFLGRLADAAVGRDPGPIPPIEPK